MLNEALKLTDYSEKKAKLQARNFPKNVTTYSDNISTAQVRIALKNHGITKVAIDGLYSDIKFNATIKHIVINAIYPNEPFMSTDYDVIIRNAEDIADGICLLGIGAATSSLTVIVDKYMPAEALEALGKATVDKNIEKPLFTVKTFPPEAVFTSISKGVILL